VCRFATVLPSIPSTEVVIRFGPTKRENLMSDHVPALNFTFGAIWRVTVLVSLLWIIGDAVDGGSQSPIAVPLLVAAWMCVIFVLDRWVSKGGDRRAG
jgi:hypothetical protein